jgi:hypothetical protein
MSDKIVIELKVKKPWQVSRGHMSHRGGSGTHKDRRTKRQRTRSQKNNAAIGEWS